MASERVQSRMFKGIVSDFHKSDEAKSNQMLFVFIQPRKTHLCTPRLPGLQKFNIYKSVIPLAVVYCVPYICIVF